MSYLKRIVWPVQWLFLLLVLAGCQANPLATAETTEQRAFAVLGLYQIVVEEAAVAVNDSAIPINVRRGIQRAVGDAKPVRTELSAAYLEYSAIRREFDVAETSEARVLAAARNLDSWVARLEPIIDRLIAAVGN